jgi:hypothetical protein
MIASTFTSSTQCDAGSLIQDNVPPTEQESRWHPQPGVGPPPLLAWRCPLLLPINKVPAVGYLVMPSKWMISIEAWNDEGCYSLTQDGYEFSRQDLRR